MFCTQGKKIELLINNLYHSQIKIISFCFTPRNKNINSTAIYEFSLLSELKNNSIQFTVISSKNWYYF